MKLMNLKASTDPPEWHRQLMKTIDYVFPNLEHITDERDNTTEWSSIMRGGHKKINRVRTFPLPWFWVFVSKHYTTLGLLPHRRPFSRPVVL